MYHPAFATLEPDAEDRDESGLRKSISVNKLKNILAHLDPEAHVCINLTTCNLCVINKEYDEQVGYIDLLDESYEEWD